MSIPQPSHYVLRAQSGSFFVKEADYFADQGGHIEEWGKAWRPVYGASSIEEARVLAEQGWDSAFTPTEQKSSLPPFPELRSTWRHKNGNLYRVEDIINVEPDRQDKYPTTVVYSNIETGKHYGRVLTRWYGSMTLEQPPYSTTDQIEREIDENFNVDALLRFNPFGKEDLIGFLRDKAAWIARGAALRAFHDGRKHVLNQRENLHCTMPLSKDEMVAITALRDGTSKLYPAPFQPTGNYKKELFRRLAEAQADQTDPLLNYLRRQWEWSLHTFGPGFRTAGMIKHIKKELVEVEKDPHDLMEWLDIVILALDGYWRHGGSPERALMILQAKQDKNFARDWPDWRTLSENQAIEHDRSKENSSEAALAC